MNAPSNILENLNRRQDRIEAAQSAAKQEHTRLYREISLAKGRLLLKDEIEDFLLLVENQLHYDLVGRYELLLTHILNDIKPDSGKVKIDITTKRGKPALEVYIETPAGHREDIMNGRGGSIANIMSIGLRYIALTQSGLTPFVVFDEADCWMRPDLVPNLSRVIASVSQQLGIQTVNISHHEQQLHDAPGHVVRVIREGDSVVIESSQPEWESDAAGVRSIYLQDFMSHTQSLIPFGQGVTHLIGANDIGKSVIPAALRAVFYGEGQETDINHDSLTCVVIIDLGPKGQLHYQRSRKGAKKTRYKLIKNDEIVNESHASDVPDWVESLGFSVQNDLAIQISHQKKDTVFILDLPDTQRAKIMAVGKETAWLTAMRDKYAEMVRMDRADVKAGEKRIAQLDYRLSKEPDVASARSKIDGMNRDAATISSNTQEIQTLQVAVDYLTDLQPYSKITVPAIPPAPQMADDVELLSQLIEQIQISQPVEQALTPLPNAPELYSDVSDIQVIIDTLTFTDCSELSITPLPAHPDFDITVNSLAELITEIEQLGNTPDISKALPTAPTFSDSDMPLLSEIEMLSAELEQLQSEAATIADELASTEREREQLIDSVGGVCPVCQTPGLDKGDQHVH